MTHRPLVAVGALALALGMAGCSRITDAQGDPTSSSSPTSAAGGIPSEQQWLADVHTAMRGSTSLLAQRAAQGSGAKKLAVNLDIDNTSVATHYDYGAPVPDVLAFARDAHRRGIAVLFNTGRPASHGGEAEAEQLLRKAGYPVTEVCGRQDGEGLVAGKKRCRQHFEDEGYTLIANVGNNPTDFAGSGYEHAFLLPNYNGGLS